MIGYLYGEILENQDGKMLVGIGERKSFGGEIQGGRAGMVGYSVTVPQSPAYPLLGVGSWIELYIYTHVREDSLDLYGFSSVFEKSVFLSLLNVNGIGPKSALTILSAADPRTLLEAIVRGDQAFLTHLPGIGKKTAERVVVELKDSLKKKLDAGFFGNSLGQRSTGIALGAGKNSSHEISSHLGNVEEALLRDAKDALLNLGYRDQDVDSYVHKALHSFDTPPKKAEDLIKQILKQMS